MPNFQHEQTYRGKEAMSKVASLPVVICGAGALGSNLAVNLTRSGFRKLRVIDRDRVEQQNIGTQVYSLEDVGGLKAEILRNLIYREVGEDVDARAEELVERNIAKLLKESTLIIDAFDNSASRKLVYDHCRNRSLDCLHLGVNDGYGEIRWNESYIVPNDVGVDVCDYPLARNLILLVVAIASEAIVNFVLNKEKRNLSVTLADLQINHEID